MKRTSVGALVLCLVGCGISRRSAGPVPSGAPADPAPDDAALAFGAWRERLAAATCARELACWAFWSSEEDCLQAASTNPAYVRFFGGIDEDTYVTATHTLAPAPVLDACIAAVTTAPCDDSRTPYEACLDVLVQKDPRQRGEPCAEYSPYVDATACGVGLVCTGAYPSLTCEPLPPAATEGGTCGGDRDCAPGLACVRDVCRECTSLPGEGESCADTGTCRGALHCSIYSELCVRPGAEHDACDSSEADSCLRDLTCILDATTGNASCHAFARRGDACPRSVDASAAACDDDSWCVFETPDAPSGTCGVAPTSAGPCALFAQDSSYFCPVGTDADPSSADSGSLPTSCNCE
jgi:hypothetical protein